MAYDRFVEREKERELIEKSKRKDERAFRMLVEHYINPIYRFVVSIVKNRGDAEDVIQDTFFSAWNHLVSFDTTRSFKTWLFTIAKNRALNWISKKKPTLFSEFTSDDTDTNTVLDTLTDSALLPSVLFDNALHAEQVRSALEKLSIKQQTVVTLHYIEDLTFEEIASILNESINTVKSRNRRALIELERILNA
jgi:RNA polymerase sigma-70 factor, ECF subfamily